MGDLDFYVSFLHSGWNGLDGLLGREPELRFQLSALPTWRAFSGKGQGHEACTASAAMPECQGIRQNQAAF